MRQAAASFVAQLVAVAGGVRLSDPYMWILDSIDRAGADAVVSDGSTMAYDGEDWFFKVPEQHRKKERPPPWHETPSCRSSPPSGSLFYSQSREDIDLYNFFFCNKKGGTFAELGALEGVRLSNTKFFEDSLGWSGLLIEASPRSAHHLKSNRANPKNGILAEGVCPDGQGTMPFLIDGSAFVHGNPDTMAGSFKDSHHPKLHRKQIDVPCRSLSTQVEEFVNRTGADHIDFFSLDVEGGEFAVLQTFNFKVPVHCWVIEMDGHNVAKDEDVRQLLTKHGYVEYHVAPSSPRNEFWVLPRLDSVDKK